MFVESYHYEHLGRNEIRVVEITHGTYLGQLIGMKPSTSVWMVPTWETFEAASDLAMDMWGEV